MVIFIYHLHYVDISSDTTTLLPMAEDILQGNWRLQGWILGTNNFYFTDLVFETLLLKCGISYENIIYGLGSFDFALLIVLSLFFSKKYLRDGQKNTTYDFLYAIPLSIILFPILIGGYTLLNLHSHISAYILGISCWMLVLRYLTVGQYWYLIIYFVFAGLGNFSDALIQMILFAPVCMSMLIAIFSKKNVKRSWTIILTNFVTYAASTIFLTTLNHNSLYLQTLGLPVHISDYHLWGQRLIGYVQELFKLYGFASHSNSNTLVYWFHDGILIAFFVLVLISLFYFGIRLKENTAPINILWFTAMINAGACVVTDVAVFNRYIGPFYVFTMLLAIEYLNNIIDCTHIHIQKVIKVGCILLAILMLLLRISVISKLTATDDKQINSYLQTNEKQIADYLQAEHLSGGYSNYWTASLIWYYTDFKIPVYQILLPKNANSFQAFPFLVKNMWWTEKSKDFVIRTDVYPYNNEIDEETLNSILGTPKKKTSIGRYTVYEYGYDISKYMQKVVFSRGWYGDEPWGRWAEGKNQEITIFAKDSSGILSLWLHRLQKPIEVDIDVNDKNIGHILVDSSTPEKFTFNLAGIENGGDIIRIKFRDKGNLVTPKEININQDTRPLGLAITKIVLNDQVIYGK